LAGLPLGGLCSHFKEKLEGYNYSYISQLQVRALVQESRFEKAKETCETHQSNTHVDCETDNSDDGKKEVYVAELVWSFEAIPYSCSSLKPIQNHRRDRFTFDVSKCDHIFDELLRNGNIKLSHAIPLLDELKRRAYCKWHNFFLMQPMIAIFSIDIFNRPLMKDDWLCMRCKLTRRHSLSHH